MKLSPSVRGIERLSWTTTVVAARMAACIASTLVPREQNPWASGGVALTNTTSSGRAPLEQARDVGQEDRDVVGASLVDRGAGVRPDEQGSMAEVARHLGRQVRPRSLDVEVDDADVAQLRGAIDQRLEHDRGRRRRAMDIELIAGGDPGDRFLGAYDAQRSVSVARHRLAAAQEPAHARCQRAAGRVRTRKTAIRLKPNRMGVVRTALRVAMACRATAEDTGRRRNIRLPSRRA